MIGLLFLALQSTNPDQVLDRTTVTRFQTTTETQPMIIYYQNCLAPPGVMIRPPVSGTSEAQAKARIAACADTRKWALSAGVSVYRAEPGGDPDPGHYINISLDQIEQGFLAQARFFDNLISGKIKPSDLRDKPVELTPGGTANHDQ